MDISVIIPTHNRATLVEQAVRSAILLDYPSDRYEIIVVDNASTDITPQLVQNLLNDSNGRRLYYVQEAQLGLHNARHAGARVAMGEILVFIDDDATADPCWLQAFAKAFGEHPEMAAAGGPVRPIWHAPPPKWLLDFMGDAKAFAPLSLMEPYDDFRLGPEAFFYGVNMAVRRNVLFAVGGFNPELIGTLTVGDGESGLIRKLRERGWLIGYVPSALVYHHIASARMTLDHLCRWQRHDAGAQMYSRYHMHLPGRLKLTVDGLQALPSFMAICLLAKCMRCRRDRLAVSLKLRAALENARFRYLLRLIYDQDLRRIVAHQDWLNSFPPVTETEV